MLGLDRNRNLINVLDDMQKRAFHKSLGVAPPGLHELTPNPFTNSLVITYSATSPWKFGRDDLNEHREGGKSPGKSFISSVSLGL